MKRLLLIPLLFLGLLSASQIKDKKSGYTNVDVNIVKISDSSFYEMLDTLLEHERKCSYYTDSLPYGIFVSKAPTDRNDSLIAVGIEGYGEKEIFLKGKSFGFISYMGHDFFIEGRNLINSLVITDEKRTFRYNENFSPEEDDSWARYTFAYYENMYILYNRSNTYRCSCK